MMAQHRVEGDQPLQPVICEFIVQNIRHVDQHEAQEFAQVVAAHAAQCEAVAQQDPTAAHHGRGRGVAAASP
jgi:hypothetical protein